MFELVRIVKRYSEATAALPADDTRAMWEQRGQWLQEEVAGLAQERIYSANQQQYWLNLILLLFAGAEACDRALREKLEVDLALQAAQRQSGELQEQLRRARQEAEEAAQRTAVPPGLEQELLELRSKVSVLSAELEWSREQAAAAAQQTQLLTAERDSLRQQVEALRGDLAAAQETADSRAEVIAQLMARTEASSGQGAAALAELTRLQGHCRTLGVNLENNAKVIEKLVELNSELMDALNAATATQEQRVRAATASGSGAAPDGGPARRESGHGGSGGGGAAAGAPWAQRNGGAHAGSGPGTTTAAANGTAPAAAGAVSVPRIPSRGGTLVNGLRASSSGHGGGGGAAAGGEPVSLTDAFAAFLRDEAPPPPPKPATAAALAAPPPPLPPLGASPSGGARSGEESTKGGSTRSGRGLGVGLMSVVRYVAGSDRPQQQRAAGTEEDAGGGLGPSATGPGTASGPR